MDKVDKVDKVEEATATVRDFDPISGSIPATKVEITVSCRWAPFFGGVYPGRILFRGSSSRALIAGKKCGKTPRQLLRLKT